MKVNPIRSYNEMKAWLENNLERKDIIRRAAKEGLSIEDVERRL